MSPQLCQNDIKDVNEIADTDGLARGIHLADILYPM